MKKILLVSNHYYPYFGGIEQTTKITAEILTDANIECKVICLNENAADGDYSCVRHETVQEVVDGISVIRCGCFAKISSQCLSLNYPYELHCVMDEFGPDYVIFHHPNPFMAQFLLGYRKKNFKLIVHYNLDITKQKILGKLFHYQTLKLLERAHSIVAVSPNYVDSSPYLNRFKEKCVIIPCCFDPNRFVITEEIKAISETIRKRYCGKIICFTCGRHVPYKGLTYLVRASKYLDNSFSILIGGTGELTDELKKEAMGDDKVEFVGRLTDKELVAYYNICDIYCFPSITKNESFGMAMAEAMYFGKPAVTFTISGSGVNYVNLNGVTGIECPNGDSKAYSEALKKLGTDEELRVKYGSAARQRVQNNFTVLQFKEKFMSLINML